MADQPTYTARQDRPEADSCCLCCGVADAEFWLVADGDALPICPDCLVENCDLAGIDPLQWPIEPERVEHIRAEVLPAGQMSGRWVAPGKGATDA